MLQLRRHPGELERDVDGEDDQAEGGKEVVEGEEEGVEGAVGGRLLPVVVDVVLDEEVIVCFTLLHATSTITTVMPMEPPLGQTQRIQPTICRATS